MSECPAGRVFEAQESINIPQEGVNVPQDWILGGRNGFGTGRKMVPGSVCQQRIRFFYIFLTDFLSVISFFQEHLIF